MKQTIYYLLVKVVKKKLMYSKYTNMQKVEVRAGKAMELKGKTRARAISIAWIGRS